MPVLEVPGEGVAGTLVDAHFERDGPLVAPIRDVRDQVCRPDGVLVADDEEHRLAQLPHEVDRMLGPFRCELREPGLARVEEDRGIDGPVLARGHHGEGAAGAVAPCRHPVEALGAVQEVDGGQHVLGALAEVEGVDGPLDDREVGQGGQPVGILRAPPVVVVGDGGEIALPGEPRPDVPDEAVDALRFGGHHDTGNRGAVIGPVEQRRHLGASRS